MPRIGRLRMGTSGWVYKDWRGIFYPPRLPMTRWFAHYAAHFDTVEVNNTFYRHVPESTFDKWREQAPPEFLYAVKANRILTHRKKLNDAAAILPDILGPARKLGPHLGPVLYQLPPHWGCDLERLRSFLGALPSDLWHVVEFRDSSWYTDEVRGLLDERGAGFCIHDLRGERTPHWATGRLAYVRFHGPTERAYHGRYSQGLLQRWAETISEFRAEGRDVFVYFNNCFDGAALADARDLRDLLELDPATT
jgi:uncharacterized protein YecE (DUF72 family)